MNAALAFAALALHAAGMADGDRVRLAIFRGPGAEACPTDDELEERVRRRIGSEPFVDAEPGDAEPAEELGSVGRREGGTDASRELRVGIGRARGGNARAPLQARVVLFSATGERLGRRVLAGDPDCAQLADDLVLALAIAIDPLLLVRRTPTAAPPAPPKAHPAPSPPPELAPVRTVTVSRPPLQDLAPPTGLSGRGVLSLAVGTGLVATPSLRGELSLDYGLLSLDGGVRFDLPARYPVGSDALLDVVLVAGHAAPCLGWDVEDVTARACAVAEVGTLVVQGIGLDDARSVTSPWAALGGRGALDVHLWPSLALVLSADVQAPLLRPRVLDDSTGAVLFEAWPVAAQLGIGLALEIR